MSPAAPGHAAERIFQTRLAALLDSLRTGAATSHIRGKIAIPIRFALLFRHAHAFDGLGGGLALRTPSKPARLL
ncbi:MAG: hypothetical protein WBP25_16555 [Giesbergeria sp.]|jgi:hypothetical protein|uniref:Uncharacterized protein n=1 Tax=Hydrogenophaga atypica TaxID=249409 RepID=A0ABW2QR14_9BURK|nr:hypothetical protein [Rhodoblastus sp.]